MTKRKKRSGTKWHKKQISTGWGVAILGFLIIVTIILIAILGQSQTLFSNAATTGVGASCTISDGAKGICENKNKTKASSTQFYVAGYCPGPTNVQCLIDETKQHPTCTTPAGSGKCYNTSNPPPANSSNIGGGFISGYCPGPTNYECYVSGKNTAASTPQGCSGLCVNKTGSLYETVESFINLNSYLKKGLCPGPANIECLTPTSEQKQQLEQQIEQLIKNKKLTQQQIQSLETELKELGINISISSK
jgi:hypothetical protein